MAVYFSNSVVDLLFACIHMTCLVYSQEQFSIALSLSDRVHGYSANDVHDRKQEVYVVDYNIYTQSHDDRRHAKQFV